MRADDDNDPKAERADFDGADTPVPARTPASCSLSLVHAPAGPWTVILRRGPSKQFRCILWNRETDRFKLGQWLRGMVYDYKCGLSTDGKYLIYAAMSGRGVSFTAISMAPYFRAIAFWPLSSTWGGGGGFVGPKHYWTQFVERPDEGPVKSQEHSKLTDITGWDEKRLDRLESKLSLPKTAARDAPEQFYAEGGQLWRRSVRDGGARLIRDFSDMTYERVEPPYEGVKWRP